MIVREADTACARAREREFDPPSHLSLSTMPLEGRRVLGTAGPCCGELGNAGYPCAPVLGGEDGALARRPQAPLEVVEKFLTRHN
jgi:hypothetical protein